MSLITGDESYKKLDISRDASMSEIKKAYHRKAFELHPDKSKKNTLDAEIEFKELNKAYHEILNEKKIDTEHEEQLHSDKPNVKKNFSENEVMNQQMNIFDFLDFSLLENYIRTRKIFQNSHRSQNTRNTIINMKSCSGKHDRFTICLKCGRY